MTASNEARSGHFVAFEGGEGAGKSTQLEAVASLALDAGLDVVSCREPGGTPFGEALRPAVLNARPHSARAELLAFCAARAELVDTVIEPALARGALVLCDRFSASTVAYQQYGRSLDASLIAVAIELAAGRLQPDLNILLDLPPETGLRRVGAPTDQFEAAGLAFHTRVREGFLAQAAADPTRWLVLDAREPAKRLTDLVWSGVHELVLTRS